MSGNNSNNLPYKPNYKINPLERDPRTFSGRSQINKCNYSGFTDKDERNHYQSSCNINEASTNTTFNYNNYPSGSSTQKSINKFNQNTNFPSHMNSEILLSKNPEYNSTSYFNVDLQTQMAPESFNFHPPTMLPPPLPPSNSFQPSPNSFSTNVSALALQLNSSVQSSFPPPVFPQPAVLPFETMPFSCFGSSIPPTFDTSCPPPMVVKSADEKDPKVWLNLWTRRHTASTIKHRALKTKITISEYKKKTVHLMTQIRELEKLTTLLQVLSKSLDDVEWEIRRKEIDNQKEIVKKAVDDLKIIPLPEIVSLLNKRKNKRSRLRRKREEYKESKKADKALCHLEHSRIDMWLDKMKDQVERTRREEDIKKQADFVLSEVFHKKAEAKRMLSLLTVLGKLRNARIHDRQSKGEFVSQDAANTFNSIIETLKKLWIKQVNGYNVEEQGLRVMLNDAEVKRSNIEKAVNKQILQQWLNIMFGGQHNENNSFKIIDMDQLIAVRKSWDQFVVKENSDVGSSMPIGWILPAPPSSDNWSKLLKS